MNNKKTPIRKCISCNENKPKKELIRVVLNKDNGVVLDTSGKLNGRGAYICKSVSCIENIRKSNKLAYSLKTKINDEIYDEILEYINRDDS